MFGHNVRQIAEGFYNDAMNKENELHDARMAICRKCLLLTNTTLGIKCNSSKCYNKDTDEYSDIPKKGFICGCGCFLDKKTRVKDASCPLSKW